MLTKRIEFTDFDGNQKVATVYFNFTQAELLAREISSGGTWKDQLLSITDDAKAGNGKKIIDTLDDILSMAYGVRDGDRFIKSPELYQQFKQTEAYSQLFMELVSEPNASADFMNALMPQSLRDKTSNVVVPEGMSEAEARSRASLQGHRAPAQQVFTAPVGTPPPVEAAPDVAQAAPPVDAGYSNPPYIDPTRTNVDPQGYTQ